MDEIDTLAEIFKALADPTRLRLVKLLSERVPGEVELDECGGGPLCVNALAHKLGITQSAVSQLSSGRRWGRGLGRSRLFFYVYILVYANI
jgi:DNA-binding transcriptional ArsR family regulator